MAPTAIHHVVRSRCRQIEPHQPNTPLLQCSKCDSHIFLGCQLRAFQNLHSLKHYQNSTFSLDRHKLCHSKHHIRRVDTFQNEELELYRLGKGEIAARSYEKNTIELTIFKINNCMVIFSFDCALVMKRDRGIGAIDEAAHARRVPRRYSETRHCPY